VKSLAKKDLAETEYADTWPEVVNSAAQLIRWTDQTWGAVANVLGGGTSINGGLYIEEEPDYFQDNFGEAPESTGIWNPSSDLEWCKWRVLQSFFSRHWKHFLAASVS
jgi:hypothetical protein